MIRTGDTLRNANEIARETEQIGHGVMSDLTDQRESLLRTQNKVEKNPSFHSLFFQISFS